MLESRLEMVRARIEVRAMFHRVSNCLAARVVDDTVSAIGAIGSIRAE